MMRFFQQICDEGAFPHGRLVRAEAVLRPNRVKGCVLNAVAHDDERFCLAKSARADLVWGPASSELRHLSINASGDN